MDPSIFVLTWLARCGRSTSGRRAGAQRHPQIVYMVRPVSLETPLPNSRLGDALTRGGPASGFTIASPSLSSYCCVRSTHILQVSLLCVRCGGWSQEKVIKLARACQAPTRTGLEVLFRFRRGLAPNPRVRAAIDRAVPARRVGVHVASASEVRRTTSVAVASVESVIPYEQRMARLHERIRAKEEAAASRSA